MHVLDEIKYADAVPHWTEHRVSIGRKHHVALFVHAPTQVRELSRMATSNPNKQLSFNRSSQTGTKHELQHIDGIYRERKFHFLEQRLQQRLRCC